MEDEELPPEESESGDAPIQVPTADDDTDVVENVEDESSDPVHPSDSPAVKDSPGSWTSWGGFNN
jgi:hypothetical protein